MTIEVTIRLPDSLADQIDRLSQRLPEALERGMRTMLAEQAAPLPDERTIIAVLTSQPLPEQVLALQPSPALQARMSELLARQQQGGLTVPEIAELERYLLLEHMIRLAKAHALQARTQP